jgi:hypothetical protein
MQNNRHAEQNIRAPQSLAVLNTKQGGLSNMQWYEHFNMRHDIARSVGVELGHKVLWEYCAQLIER